MSPSVRKLFLAAVFGGAVAAVAPAVASAQFGTVRYNYQFGLYPSAQFNPFLPTLPTAPGRFAFSGYTMTGVGLNGPYSVSVGYYKNTSLTIAPAYSPYSGGYYGGVGGGSVVNNGAVANRQRSAIASAQKGAKLDEGVKPSTPDFELWMKEQVNRREANDPAKPVAIDPALLTPPAEAIRNGDALNRLVGLVSGLEAKGKKAESGLCGPELMGAVVFEGGPGADAANQFRTAELEYPEVLKGMPFDDLRDGLSKAYSAVAVPAHAGKRVLAAEVDRLLKELAKARQTAAPLLKEASLSDTAEASQFFTHLESAAKFLKDPNATGVAGEKWTSIGATIADLVKHSNRFKLRFGPAAAGDEAAYESLYRGLLTYYAGLMQAK